MEVDGESAGPNVVGWIKERLKSLFVEAKTRKQIHVRQFSGAGCVCLVVEQTSTVAAHRWSRQRFRTTRPHKRRGVSAAPLRLQRPLKTVLALQLQETATQTHTRVADAV